MYLLNGKNKHSIDFEDRGFQYGDGLFETIRVSRHTPLFLDLHLARLAEGCQRLLIPSPDRTLLVEESVQLAARQADAVLKIIITRGQGGRGYKPPANVAVTRLLGLYPPPNYPENFYTSGISLRICQYRLASNPVLAGIKHLNRLEQILARAEWSDADDFQEGVMMNQAGHVIEGTMSNLFLVQNGILLTPPIDQCGVSGIVRRIILDLAKQLKIPVHEEHFTLGQLFQADEVFMTNSIIGIWPVKKIEEHTVKVGPVTRKFAIAYSKLALQSIT